MTSYDRQSLEAAIAQDTSRGIRFLVHEADLAYTLELTLAETSLPNIQTVMQPFLNEKQIDVEFDIGTRDYVFFRQDLPEG